MNNKIHLIKWYREKSYRTKNVLLGSFSLVFSQVLISIIGFIVTGMIARYFLPDEFGLWTLLMSLTGILVGLDFGFGNALRNKLAQIYAKKNEQNNEGQVYFLSIFYSFLLWAIFLSVIIVFLKPFIPWNILFNTNKINIINEGSWVFVIGSAISAVNVAFTLCTLGFFSYQEGHWSAIFGFLSKFLIFIFTILFIYLHQSFFSITVMFFFTTLLSSVTSFYVFLYRRGWKVVFVKFDILWKKIKELWNKSLQFTLLQIFAIIYASADLFLISKILGLEAVGEYSLVKKLYLLFAGFQFALLMPIWSAYTEAVESKDFGWIKKILKKTVLYTLILFIVLTVMLSFLGKYFIYFWTGKNIANIFLYILLGIWSLIFSLNNCFSVFLNAIGNLKIQIILAGISIFTLIPLSFFWSKEYGIIGICFALIVSIIPASISNPIQSYIFLKKKSQIKT
jgi:O-antigen/teichoic acid export membrane protein